jgi:PadR family transcriptional regulator PadR
MTQFELETQNLARASHEAMILAILADGPRHGYRSGGTFRFNHGTLYPILHKLEANGYIEGSWAEPAGKRKRRQYEMTAAGKDRLGQLQDAWTAYVESLFNVIAGGSS